MTERAVPLSEKRKGKGLGRGLAALLDSPDAGATPPAKNTPSQTPEIVYHQPNEIKTGLYQPRHTFDNEALDELAQSIKEQGILQPLLVRRGANNTIELVAGERRLRAAKRAGLATVPCRTLDISPEKAREASLLENIQRKDLSPIEEAMGYRQLLDELAYTQEQLSEKLGKSRSHITNMLRLLSLPKEVQQAVDSEHLSAGHARALLSVENPTRLAQKVMKSGWSVRQIEAYVKRLSEPAAARQAKREAKPRQGGGQENSADERALVEQLTKLFGVNVSLNLDADQSGVLQFSFASPSELDLLLKKITQACLHSPDN